MGSDGVHRKLLIITTFAHLLAVDMIPTPMNVQYILHARICFRKTYDHSFTV